MKIGSAFPSKNLKADDLQGQEVSVTISGVEMEDVSGDGEQKPVLHFTGKEKGMVLNRTNYGRLQMFFPDFSASDDSADLIGKKVILYAEPVSFQGRMVKGLRLKVPPQAQPEGDEPPF